jgi:hypothetical protein
LTRTGDLAAPLLDASEQGKLPAAKAFKLAERDKHMSEQEKPKGFMQQLETWTNKEIIAPLLDNGPAVIPDVHEAIRAKVLESYRNGQAAGPKPARPARKEQRSR